MESKKDLPGLVGRMCFLPKFKHNKCLTLLSGSFNHHFYQKPWQTLLCWNFYHFNHDTDGEPPNVDDHNHHSSNSKLTLFAYFLQAGVQFPTGESERVFLLKIPNTQTQFQIHPPKYKKKPPQCWFRTVILLSNVHTCSYFFQASTLALAYKKYKYEVGQ